MRIGEEESMNSYDRHEMTVEAVGSKALCVSSYKQPRINVHH
jgi:hypothetical protein